MATKTIDQVRAEFHRSGQSITEWASMHGFNRKLVYDVLADRRRALRGQTHDIAVELGLKKGKRRPSSAPTFNLEKRRRTGS